MRLSIRYLTTFTYDAAVSESQNALRARPAADDGQGLIHYAVTVDPPTSVVSYTDYWGTWVDSFGIVGQHTRLTVVADSVVETNERPVPSASVPWDGEALLRSGFFEYLSPSPHVSWHEDVTDFARETVAGGVDAVAAARDVAVAVGDLLTYEAGATEVGTSVGEIWEQRRGVCQDYAHLALALYRCVGLPARYVSGYLYASDSASGERPEQDEVDVATHAWVEVYIPEFGWWGLDPTNQLTVGERHVKIGHGRDYEDVMPLRGVYHGNVESDGLEVAVKISRTDISAYRMRPRPSLEHRQPTRDQQVQQQQ